jgi:aminoglycoside 3-N-acetyltransferase
MISRLQAIVPERWHPLITPAYRRIRRSWTQLDRTVDRRTLREPELVDLLQAAGFVSGAAILVHSSMDEIVRRAPQINAMRLIGLLQELLGSDGTLMMPTFPFMGTQFHYVQGCTTFDVKRTPSQVGLLTEVFRRSPAVVRSLHPTHPFAAWGLKARELTETHHRGGTFGLTSPICRLSELGGSVVGIGVGLRDSFTILHVPEEIHPAAREHFLQPNPCTMRVTNGPERFDYVFQALRPGVRRNYDRVEKAMLRAGTLRRFHSHGLVCTTADADRFIRHAMNLIDQGKYL